MRLEIALSCLLHGTLTSSYWCCKAFGSSCMYMSNLLSYGQCLYVLHRLVHWEDVVTTEAMQYIPCDAVSGAGRLVKRSQERQLRTIATALELPTALGINDAHVDEGVLLHLSPQGAVAGQLDIKFLESLGFSAEASIQHKASTVLLGEQANCQPCSCCRRDGSVETHKRQQILLYRPCTLLGAPVRGKQAGTANASRH